MILQNLEVLKIPFLQFYGALNFVDLGKNQPLKRCVNQKMNIQSRKMCKEANFDFT